MLTIDPSRSESCVSIELQSQNQCEEGKGERDIDTTSNEGDNNSGPYKFSVAWVYNYS